MSIEINWEALTGGSAGDALAESIRAFIHERFQQVELPKLIRSVKVHAFDFGNVPPELVLKDVCDPLPDFYDDGDDDDDDDNEDDDLSSASTSPKNHVVAQQEQRRRDEMYAHEVRMRSQSNATTAAASEARGRPFSRPTLNTSFTGAPSMRSTLASPTGLLRAQTPGIPGGTANMSYFHLPLSSTRSGAITPLAAVAGGHYGGWPEMHQSYNHSLSNDYDQISPELQRTSTSQYHNQHHASHSLPSPPSPPLSSLKPKAEDKSPDDVQIVAHLRYSGNIKLSLTAEILLDYPMPSFVGIPVQLNVTGLTFDGVAVIAYIKKKAHFCFLTPEDAEVVVGSDDGASGVHGRHEQSDNSRGGFGSGGGGGVRGNMKVGGLFEEIKVESEIGLKVQGKQVLKNVGRVENFVLEQVRRIFESEFVYPNFWTFLV